MHRLTLGEENRTQFCQRGVPVNEAYGTQNSLSTENARELPKYRKSLHFQSMRQTTEALAIANKERKNHPEKAGALSSWGCLAGPNQGFTPEVLGLLCGLASEVQFRPWGRCYGELCMNGAKSGSERRKWARLPLAIPVFVRSKDDQGKEFLEFATSLNVSAGGMLVAIRRTLPPVAQIRLEIPSAPVAAMAMLPRAARTLNARTLRTTPADGYYLLGLKFARPLSLGEKPPVRRRKLLSRM